MATKGVNPFAKAPAKGAPAAKTSPFKSGKAAPAAGASTNPFAKPGAPAAGKSFKKGGKC